MSLIRITKMKKKLLEMIIIQPVSWWDQIDVRALHEECSTTRLASNVLSVLGPLNLRSKKLHFDDHYEHELDHASAVGCHVAAFDMPQRLTCAFSDLEELDLHITWMLKTAYKLPLARHKQQVDRFLSTPHESLRSLTIRCDLLTISNNTLEILELMVFNRLTNFRLELVTEIEHDRRNRLEYFSDPIWTSSFCI
ncbi:hypothetical protein BU23DRAFT_96111 [Bimuria novae-zelandiae CBS 107.79]|uniref:Uncharacterized protein n=1 Tax=Bimuria novae-zelandiae CBS 107.79 TaxID=1447943 RepID=A0A6A5VAX3_9PLEO|nr:hypothetical protein BU23DRAFT_96111 [Bimuria novae-zelandiae CBS 107.79]